jgi:NADH dehydrogenase
MAKEITKVQQMEPSSAGDKRHRVIVVGGGFGGIQTVSSLAGSGASVTLVDQRNHLLFQPLLYQVATASLTTSDIAWPIRRIFRNRPEVETLLATVKGVDADAKRVQLDDGTSLLYDTLVIATGAEHAYFGHEEWAPFAPGLKTIEDAISFRRAVLLSCEQAERETDPKRRDALLTFVIVGAGATGVEIAGAVADLARATLPRDFRNINTQSARVVLIEGGARVLSNFPETLSEYTKRTLEGMGVEVELGRSVTECSAAGVKFGNQFLECSTIIWAAGVKASPAAKWLGAEADRSGRLKVLPDLTVPGRPDVFAIGDTVTIGNADGKIVPGVAPAAKQQGKFVAQVIRARLSRKEPPKVFHYRNGGSLAQIGKRRAVIDFGRVRLTGPIAWWIWSIVHIYFLIGIRTRLSVALSWLWILTRDQRSSRLITQGTSKRSNNQ